MSNLDKLKEYNLLQYIEQISNQKAVKVGLNTYRFKKCPICGTGDHFTVDISKNLYNGFNNSCGGGSIIDFYMSYYGKDKNYAIRELCEQFNLINDSSAVKNFKTKEVKTIEKSPAKVTKSIDLTSVVNSYYTSAKNDLTYPIFERGIQNDNILNKYKLLVGDPREILKENLNLLPGLKNVSDYEYILPVWESGKVVNLILRRNDKKSLENAKTLNLKGVEVRIFNLEYIRESGNQFIFICEGIFDCLSIECHGYKSIGLNSVNMANRLIQSIKDNIDVAKNHTYILCGDNDKAGKQLKEKLMSEFSVLEIKFAIMNIPELYKDVNEYQINDEDGLRSTIEEVINNTDIDSAYYFLTHHFYKEVDKYISFKNKSTGFDKLDMNLDGIAPALYLLGAESSLGKTTFFHQIADNIASNGDSVLYFSLEQSKMELVSKSLSRIAYKEFGEKVSSRHIIYNTDREITAQAIDKYKSYAKNMIVYEGNFNTTVKDIKDKIQRYILLTGKKPVVFIDYLQVIQAIDFRMSDKQKVDINITELKRISRDLFIPLFVISSLNRGNYLSPISYEAFKESGSIEFTADVLFGLQYKVIHDIQEIKKVSEQREVMSNARLANPRKIELMCLKNRGGRQTFRIDFEYFPSYNYFLEK